MVVEVLQLNEAIKVVIAVVKKPDEVPVAQGQSELPMYQILLVELAECVGSKLIGPCRFEGLKRRMMTMNHCQNLHFLQMGWSLVSQQKHKKKVELLEADD